MFKEDRLHITINSILYILNRLGGEADFLKVFKMLYFAEMEHLSIYGRMFTENKYNSFPKGPVPDYAYQGMRSLRGDVGFSLFEDKKIFEENFKVHSNHFIISLSSEDLDELAISEIKCLDKSINQNKNLTFNQLSKKSHGTAWKSKMSNYDVIELLEIAKEAEMTIDMIDYSLELDSLKNSSFY
jgi:uncharacterized phage-associated protein